MSSRVFKLASLLLVFCVAGCHRKTPGVGNGSAGFSNSLSDQFLTLMSGGKNYLDQGDATNALALFRKAEALVPNSADVRINLANAYLLAENPSNAIAQAAEALKLEPNSAAAYFVKGSAYLRLFNWEEATKALENARKIDPGESATYFQLGRARLELKQWAEAIAAFKEGLAMDPNHLHTTVHYLLAQGLLRAGRQVEAEAELQQHQASLDAGGPAANPATFERSKYTQARVPFNLEQPAGVGVKIQFVDATSENLESAPNLSGPIGIIDATRTGSKDLFVLEKGRGFRLLARTNGMFRMSDALYPAIPGAHYAKTVVGDLQNDRFEDVVLLGDKGSHLFSFGSNGLAIDASNLSGLSNVFAREGILIDLDFTGKLDLMVVGNDSHVRLYRQLGALHFSDVTSTSGIPVSLQNAQALAMEDWNRDGIMDVIASRNNESPLFLEKQRGGRLVPSEPTGWDKGSVFCTGDFDNDLRPDLAVLTGGQISIYFNGGERKEIPIPHNANLRQIVAIDYDNDGWLDLWGVGDKICAWRNRGLLGFEEQTAELGLDKFDGGPISEIQFADFDGDCDSDVIIALSNGGLRYLRNDGGNLNSQVKVQLMGNRSNASGIGCRVEIESGGLRLMRTVQRLPVEIGVGQHQSFDSFLVHWFNWPQGSANLPFNCKEPILSLELTLQEGSCPYLYAWDGTGFQFVTDILGAAPLGLPIAEGRYLDANPVERIWVGDERTFLPRSGKYELRITEELREVLYLDEAKLIVVDRQPATEVHSTDKLLPGKPFGRSGLMTLHREHPLRRAELLDGTDVTSELKSIDHRRVSPPKLRVPQLRGLAEPHGLILDFGPLDASIPMVLVMNGWLRFGGGMANIAASHDPSLPYPFPSLEAEVAPGIWRPVDVTVGAPAGKTKTILVDLEGKLEKGTRRFRLTGAFEIYWDRIAIMEKKSNSQTKITAVTPTAADLHFRGFSELEPLAPDWPSTPDYNKVSKNSVWTVLPGGWCTRYGDVSELIASRDEGLALINGGDELSLSFEVSAVLPKPEGWIREFFLYLDGWDKDSDFHVAAGTQVEPLPFHGMRDELYGREKRPAFPTDAMHVKYNTRWVDGQALKQTAKY